MTIEIVDLPSYEMVIFHSYVNVYQRASERGLIRDTMVTATVDLPHVIADFGTQQPTHETNPQIWWPKPWKTPMASSPFTIPVFQLLIQQLFPWWTTQFFLLGELIKKTFQSSSIIHLFRRWNPSAFRSASSSAPASHHVLQKWGRRYLVTQQMLKL